MQFGLKMSEMCKYLYVYRLHLLFINSCAVEVLFFASNFSSSGLHGTAMVVYSLPIKSRTDKGWLVIVFDIFVRHSFLVRDITDTDCWAQNGSTHSCVLTAFRHWCVTNRTRFNKQGEKLSNKLLCICFLFHCYWCGFWCFFSSPLRLRKLIITLDDKFNK